MSFLRILKDAARRFDDDDEVNCRAAISVAIQLKCSAYPEGWQDGDRRTAGWRDHRTTTALSADWTGDKITHTAPDGAGSRLPWRRRNWTLAYTTPAYYTCTASVHYYFSCWRCSRRPLLLL